MNTTHFASALAGITMLLSGAAQALPAVTVASQDWGRAQPIQGWTDFCRSYPGECTVDRSEPETIRLDAETWRTIVEVNQRVNAAVRPTTDWEAYGLADLWTFPTGGFGDCEDYQLLKRNLLAQAGVPRRAMRMTVVIDENDEGHAVLMLRTDRGDFILDNVRDAVLPWHDTGYVYVKREGSSGDAWTSLGHVRSPTATARGN
ncbi:transglutaminase-like cysteine peptidase [Salinarimonas rosea]|uniref:transglutaminase-like cysteine peptidase n=1 Tax=Salinarimonas rosea TaxID=552063 RepID=UPI0004040207